MATESINMYQGSHLLTNENPLIFEANEIFSMTLGWYLEISYAAVENASRLEIWSNNERLPGSHFFPLAPVGRRDIFKVCLTQDAVNTLEANGLVLSGENIDVFDVSIVESGETNISPSGKTVWAGNYDCSTALIIYGSAFKDCDEYRYVELAFHDQDASEASKIFISVGASEEGSIYPSPSPEFKNGRADFADIDILSLFINENKNNTVTFDIQSGGFLKSITLFKDESVEAGNDDSIIVGSATKELIDSWGNSEDNYMRYVIVSYGASQRSWSYYLPNIIYFKNITTNWDFNTNPEMWVVTNGFDFIELVPPSAIDFLVHNSRRRTLKVTLDSSAHELSLPVLYDAQKVYKYGVDMYYTNASSKDNFNDIKSVGDKTEWYVNRSDEHVNAVIEGDGDDWCLIDENTNFITVLENDSDESRTASTITYKIEYENEKKEVVSIEDPYTLTIVQQADSWGEPKMSFLVDTKTEKEQFDMSKQFPINVYYDDNTFAATLTAEKNVTTDFDLESSIRDLDVDLQFDDGSRIKEMGLGFEDELNIGNAFLVNFSRTKKIKSMRKFDVEDWPSISMTQKELYLVSIPSFSSSNNADFYCGSNNIYMPTRPWSEDVDMDALIGQCDKYISTNSFLIFDATTSSPFYHPLDGLITSSNNQFDKFNDYLIAPKFNNDFEGFVSSLVVVNNMMRSNFFLRCSTPQGKSNIKVELSTLYLPMIHHAYLLGTTSNPNIDVVYNDTFKMSYTYHPYPLGLNGNKTETVDNVKIDCYQIINKNTSTTSTNAELNFIVSSCVDLDINKNAFKVNLRNVK